MSRLVQTYVRLLDKYPWRTTMFSTGTLMAFGDVISQTTIEKTPISKLDSDRTSRFFLMGCVCVGPTLRCWYGILEKLVATRGFASLVPVQKMVLDQTLFAPTFLLFFTSTMSFWKTASVEQVKKDLKKDYAAILLTNYKMWPAVQIVNFYLIPLQHRVLFVNVFALIWNTYLAYKTNQDPHNLDN